MVDNLVQGIIRECHIRKIVQELIFHAEGFFALDGVPVFIFHYHTDNLAGYRVLYIDILSRWKCLIDIVGYNLPGGKIKIIEVFALYGCFRHFLRCPGFPGSNQANDYGVTVGNFLLHLFYEGWHLAGHNQLLKESLKVCIVPLHSPGACPGIITRRLNRRLNILHYHLPGLCSRIVGLSLLRREDVRNLVIFHALIGKASATKLPIGFQVTGDNLHGTNPATLNRIHEIIEILKACTFTPLPQPGHVGHIADISCAGCARIDDIGLWEVYLLDIENSLAGL